MWQRLLVRIDGKTMSKSGEIILKWITKASHEAYKYVLFPFFLLLYLDHFYSLLCTRFMTMNTSVTQSHANN